MKTKFLPFLYTVLFATIFLNVMHAQVVTACNDVEGGIQIWFDYNQNCPNAPGDMAGLEAIGFHSGANGWANVVEWNGANAVNGINKGDDTFIVSLNDVDAYYGAAVTAINFVFNQGPGNLEEPWGAEGKEDDGAGGCADFYLELANITETCPTIDGIHVLRLDKEIQISPNPMDDSAIISFDNPENEPYNIRLSNSYGQVVYELFDFTGNNQALDRNDLVSGFYFLNLTNHKGQIASKRIVLR